MNTMTQINEIPQTPQAGRATKPLSLYEVGLVTCAIYWFLYRFGDIRSLTERVIFPSYDLGEYVLFCIVFVVVYLIMLYFEHLFGTRKWVASIRFSQGTSRFVDIIIMLTTVFTMIVASGQHILANHPYVILINLLAFAAAFQSLITGRETHLGLVEGDLPDDSDVYDTLDDSSAEAMAADVLEERADAIRADRAARKAQHSRPKSSFPKLFGRHQARISDRNANVIPEADQNTLSEAEKSQILAMLTQAIQDQNLSEATPPEADDNVINLQMPTQSGDASTETGDILEEGADQTIAPADGNFNENNPESDTTSDWDDSIQLTNEPNSEALVDESTMWGDTETEANAELQEPADAIDESDPASPGKNKN